MSTHATSKLMPEAPRPTAVTKDLPYETLIVLGCAIGLLIYSFWNSLLLLGSDWSEPGLSHGWLVPIIAAGLLWMRWDPGVVPELDRVPAAARWWGVGLLCAGLSVRLLAAIFGNEGFDKLAFLPCLAGIVLLIGGWRMLLWSGPVIAFLFFMFPLPSYRVQQSLLDTAQKVATMGAEYVLQTLGYGAFREGNTITIGEQRLEVVEACSGLRMATVLTAMTAAIAIIIDRPIWERCLVFVSGLFIAVGVNIFRVSITAMGYYHGGHWWGDFFHGELVAAVYMMGLAALLLWLEIALLGRLLVDGPAGTAPASVRPSGRPRRPDSMELKRSRGPSGG